MILETITSMIIIGTIKTGNNSKSEHADTK